MGIASSISHAALIMSSSKMFLEVSEPHPFCFLVFFVKTLYRTSGWFKNNFTKFCHFSIVECCGGVMSTLMRCLISLSLSSYIFQARLYTVLAALWL